VSSNKRRKLIRITLGLILLLTIVNITIPFIYAISWGSIPNTRLTWEDDIGDFAPSLAQAQDGRIWFVWHSFEGGEPGDILYKVYNGSSTFPWSPTQKLTTDLGDDKLPSVTTTADGNIWVVWSSNRNGNYDIYCKNSSDNGETWSPDTQLTNNSSTDWFPSIMQTSNGTIWLAWSTDRTGNEDIYFKTSTDNGTTWSPDTPLPDPVQDNDWDPSIVGTADDEIWFVWCREDNIHYKVYNGTWSPDDELTSDPNILDWRPSIMQASNDDIWVVWDSEGIPSGQSDIYYKIHNGVGWSTDPTQVTFYPGEHFAPSIMQDIDGTIWIAWTSDLVEGNFDIYYKTDSPPEHDYDVAIFSVTYNPNVTVASPGLIINIEVVTQNQGAKSIFAQVECYVNSTQLGSYSNVHISKGLLAPLTFTWNTSNVPPGTYTIIANASIRDYTDTDPADNTFIDGEVYVKIPGDVNGDKVVDVYDLSDLSKAYGSELGDPNWNQDCDFNRDNKVDASDLFDLSNNYGKTI